MVPEEDVGMRPSSAFPDRDVELPYDHRTLPAVVLDVTETAPADTSVFPVTNKPDATAPPVTALLAESKMPLDTDVYPLEATRN